MNYYLRQIWYADGYCHTRVTGAQNHTFGTVQDGGDLAKIWHADDSR